MNTVASLLQSGTFTKQFKKLPRVVGAIFEYDVLGFMISLYLGTPQK